MVCHISIAGADRFPGALPDALPNAEHDDWFLHAGHRVPGTGIFVERNLLAGLLLIMCK